MAASTTDKITDVRNAARPNSARVSTGRSALGTTLSCDSLTGWPTASKVHGVTYQIDSNSSPVAGTQLDFYAIRSGNDLTSFTVVDGTDTGNAVNDVVEMLPTAAWGQDLADALSQVHERTGLLKANIQITTPTITSPTFDSNIDINDSSTAIRDTSDNELLKFAKTASAVNEITVGNASTGNDPYLSATGGDSNIDFAINAKGSGDLIANGMPMGAKAWTTWSPTFANFTAGSATIVAKYTQIGKTVHFYIKITLSGSTMGTAPTFTLPLAASSTEPTGSQGRFLGLAHYFDASGGDFTGVISMATTTTARFFLLGTAGTYANHADPTSTVPWTWADSDALMARGTYETA